MTRFAEGTRVEVASSRAEIEKLVTRFGATRFMIATDSVGHTAAVQFFAKERMIRLTLSLGQKGPSGTPVPVTDAEARRRWRSLALLLKAKLVAVDDGLVEFEQEFLPNIVMADGVTVYERTRDGLRLEYQSGKPTLFLGAPAS